MLGDDGSMNAKQAAREKLGVRSSQLSPTERRNPRSRDLDKMSAEKGLELMLREESRVAAKLLAHRAGIARVVRLIARAFQRGGRLIYVGAGTSGRLGVLDASECPPTFRSPPEQVQGIIAGGDHALRHSIEGAEDDRAAGAAEIAARRCDCRDVVVGIAASGTTPYVWGALERAREQGSATVMVCFNPYLQVPRKLRPKVLLAIDLGPEVLTGSTRLKAGTATKLLLNMFTTLAMVRTGKVISNLMVDVNPSNVKLRARAIRIASELAGCDPGAAQLALEHCGWEIKKAVARLKKK